MTETIILSNEQINVRNFWRSELIRISGQFDADSAKVAEELATETQNNGLETLLGHLRLCGAIPEQYDHDSSEEKLYSKYTDTVIHEAFKMIGCESAILTARADVADVEAVTDSYSFVADAKAFRLSRTAKNQKDFKVQAMDRWKHGKPYAMVVAPVYQLPSRSSQIYQQAATNNVCIGTYSHLAVLCRLAISEGPDASISLLHEIFRTVEALNPSKSGNDYWVPVNRTMLNFIEPIKKFWKEEKIAASEAVDVLRTEALEFYAGEREKIMRMTKDEAVKALIQRSKIDERIRTIKNVSDSKIMEII